MSNSKLVDFTLISPNSSARTGKISKITIHHMASTALTIEACGNEFQRTDRQASSNYGVGTDGRIGLYVDESRRAWTSSNRENDNVAVTIEVQNDTREPDWHVSDEALEATIALCVDICQRNGIPRLNYTGDKTGNLTMHKWFAATQCPGPYLESKFPYIAEQVNARLGTSAAPETPTTPIPSTKLWRVQVGAYGSAENAAWYRKQLETAGFDAYVVVVDDSLWRVQVGNCKEKAEAEQLREQLIAKGYTGIVTTLGGTPTTIEDSSEVTPPTSDTEEVVEMKVKVLKKGANGDQVKALQALLLGYGYDVGRTGVDGSFGPATDSALRKYQSRNGLTTDGSVGPATWRKLLGV